MGNPTFPGYTTDNGANWVGEIVQSTAGCFLNWNFAYGGATVNASLVLPYEPTVLSFIDQVTLFTNYVGKKPKGYKWNSDNTAVAIWLGVNDVGNSYYYPNYTAIYEADLNSYFGQMTILWEAGVRKFLLLNTPPTYRSPFIVGEGSYSVDGLKRDIPLWNDRLVAQAGAWSFEYENSTIDILDTFSIFNTILDSPKKYGATNSSCFDGDGTTCLWWNNYHPGQAIQKAVGVAAYNKLFGPGSLNLVDES